MKRFLLCMAAVCSVVTVVFGQKVLAGMDDLLSPNEIYVFTQKGCPHCWAAEAYLKEKKPNLKVQIKDIADAENRTLFFVCGAKFGLDKMQMGTPLFCMGDKYIMGWNSESQDQFEEYAKNFAANE